MVERGQRWLHQWLLPSKPPMKGLESEGRSMTGLSEVSYGRARAGAGDEVDLMKGGVVGVKGGVASSTSSSGSRIFEVCTGIYSSIEKTSPDKLSTDDRRSEDRLRHLDEIPGSSLEKRSCGRQRSRLEGPSRSWLATGDKGTVMGNE
uniref:Uncharacterized protein n=1 Tax=Haptolina brevifila TaxID=156173 RepID=A0A7S2H3L0_9EUKA|mmetsp:Transcript_50937/g.101291  ORF Transcript_50937/g.101291 Transcript_50937/m.101291 type:complete len:148 (+) Transcript_50937:211-654(+)